MSALTRSLVALALTLACGGPQPASAPAPERGAPAPAPADAPVTVEPLVTEAGARVDGPIAVTHGGVGSPSDLSDGPELAAARALARLRDGGDGAALAAAVEGTAALEDDPRFNAGTGANIRLDGRTIQMDASLMTDDGRFAAVAVIERVRNPIRAARLVLDSPHVMLAGEGATRFAHKLGLADELPTTPASEAKYRERLARLIAARGQVEGEPTGDAAIDWRAYWNFPGELPPELAAWSLGGDTVGTVTRDGDGRFAATLSTGGTSVTLYGRVGDVPIYGAGLYAGPAGAVACTGHGEEIIRQGLARAVYNDMSRGTDARAAVAHAARSFPAGSTVGLIAVDRRGWGVAANRDMAHAVASDAAAP